MSVVKEAATKMPPATNADILKGTQQHGLQTSLIMITPELVPLAPSGCF
jgi:hypothetical protein